MTDAQPTPLFVRTHDRIAYRSCRRRWHLSSLMEGRLGLEPKRRISALWLGTGVHYGLEKYYQPGWERGPAPQNTFLEWVEAWKLEHLRELEEFDNEEATQFLQDVSTGYTILANYVDYAPDIDDFEVLAPEQVFVVPVRDAKGQQLQVNGRPVFYKGRWDGIIRDRRGSIWILEHKTAAQAIDERKLWNDDQVGSYIWAAEYAGYEHIAGVLYNVLLKKTPIYPEKVYVGTKREGLSRAAATLSMTTYAMYLERLREYEYEEADYATELEILERKGMSGFFERFQVERSRTEVSEIGLRIWMEASEMLNPNTFLYPNPDPIRCPWCPFFSPCLAMSDGGDWRDILAENYQKRTTNEPDDDLYLPA